MSLSWLEAGDLGDCFLARGAEGAQICFPLGERGQTGGPHTP